MDESRDAQAVLWLVILNGVAARDDASGLDGFGMARISSFGRQFGTHRRFIATFGSPPMAYTSLSAFAAAI